MESIVRKSGYLFVDYDGMGMYEIQKDDACDIFKTDEEAVNQAIADGIKVIPIEELPDNFDMRHFGWLDTTENRSKIQEYCNAAVISGDTKRRSGLKHLSESAMRRLIAYMVVPALLGCYTLWTSVVKPLCILMCTYPVEAMCAVGVLAVSIWFLSCTGCFNKKVGGAL